MPTTANIAWIARIYLIADIASIASDVKVVSDAFDFKISNITSSMRNIESMNIRSKWVGLRI